MTIKHYFLTQKFEKTFQPHFKKMNHCKKETQQKKFSNQQTGQSMQDKKFKPCFPSYNRKHAQV